MYKIATAFCALLWPLLNRESAAQSATEHPYLGLEEPKRETCLSCHPDKVEGKFVHAAGRANCESCHLPVTAGGRTTMGIKGIGAALCTGCHEETLRLATHPPVSAGECLVCHNPHASAFAGQTRAAIRTLCMSCHGVGSPDVKVDREQQRVSLLGGRTIDLASYESARKVSARHGDEGKSAVAGTTCVACHAPHGGAAKPMHHGGRP
jgi:predicted CXXCH cytochrome family protein